MEEERNDGLEMYLKKEKKAVLGDTGAWMRIPSKWRTITQLAVISNTLL